MESTYCTVSEVTAYAEENGEESWLALVQTALTGAVNNASGYTAGSKSMAVDGFGDDVNRIAAGAKFKVDTDSTETEHTIISTKYNQETVEIDFRPGLTENVADNDGITILSTSATMAQKRLLVQAVKDIIRYHKQMYPDSSLWLPDNADLKKANKIQAIHLSKVMDMRDRATEIGELTGGSFSDGSISIEGVTTSTLHPDARFLIDKVLDEYRDVLIPPRGVYCGR